MNRDQVMASDALKRRFIKDCNLPIQLTDNPYFIERVMTLELTHKAMTQFNTFCDELGDFDNEQDYFEYYTHVKEAAMERIENSEAYKQFINRDDLKVDRNEWPEYPKNNLYKEENDGANFISIDMHHANFSCLNHYDSTIFEDENGDKAESWVDFLSQFTYYEHILHSKYIRQVIMGHCNPKKQIQYQESIMIFLAREIRYKYPHVAIYSVKTDEILIRADDDFNVWNGTEKLSFYDIIECVANAHFGVGELMAVKMFNLEKIKTEKDGYIVNYVKPFVGTELKGVPADVYHQYVKYLYDMPIYEHDLVFRYNKRLARYLEAVENPWEESEEE